MARVVAGGKRAAIDPLKHSAPLGGALVFLGLDAAMPVMHGSQGCASFAKALLTRHFREPIPLQTTAVSEVTAVLGAGDSMLATLEAIRGKQRPQVIGLLTTGLTEVSGEDVAGELRSYLVGLGADGGLGADAPLIVGVSTPDFRGGLSDGYAAALKALVQAVPLAETAAARGPAVMAGAAVSAGDTDEIVDLIAAFGLDPSMVPDIAGSLDGHLGEFSPVTTGGTTRAELSALGDCGLIMAIGATAAPAADALAERTGIEAAMFTHLCGLEATDAFVKYLMDYTNMEVPQRVRRWRARLADALLDAHFVLAGARVALAAEPDLLCGVTSLLHDVGAEIVAAVSPTQSPVLEFVPCDEVVIGDLDDLDERAADAGAELILASSHARALAERLGAAHLAVGFPVYDRMGAQLRATAGYRGSLQLLTDAANCLLDHHEHVAPHTRIDSASPECPKIEETLC